MSKIVSIFAFIILLAFPTFAAENKIDLSSGQTVYVAIYSNIFWGPKERPFELAAMLSIRNTDLHNQITVISAEYFDNNGKTLREYVKTPIFLAPLASQHFTIKERDKSGGFGANFIVRWKSTKEVNPPIIESVMIGTQASQGISFVSQGKVIAENTQ